MKTIDLIMMKREKIKEIIEQCQCSDPKLRVPNGINGSNDQCDIDIIVTPSDEADGWEIAGAELSLEELLGTKVDLICRTVADKKNNITTDVNLIDI